MRTCKKAMGGMRQHKKHCLRKLNAAILELKEAERALRHRRFKHAEEEIDDTIGLIGNALRCLAGVNKCKRPFRKRVRRCVQLG